MNKIKKYRIFGLEFIKKIKSEYEKEIHLFGIKIYSKKYKVSFNKEHEEMIELFRNYILDNILLRNGDLDCFNLLEKVKHITFLYPKEFGKFRGHNLENLFPNKKITYINEQNWQSAEVFITLVFGHGMSFSALKNIYCMQTPMIITEETFLRSIVPAAGAPPNCEFKYLSAVSHFFDAKSVHFYSGQVSSLEETINSDFQLTKEQKAFSERMIDKIVGNYLSKYNCQPITPPHLPENGKENILVVDQIIGDLSISMTGGDEKVFYDMLYSAIEENSDCNIIIKGHVDKRDSYYQYIDLPENVYYYSEDINIFSLMKKMKKVYVYSSGCGMDALLLHKELHVFGSPIYAGWGLTNDKRTFINRTKKRRIEELFYIIYIVYTRYCNPIKEKPCDIEEAIDVLLKLRNEFFKKYK